mmetsp:Transcript_10597/g.24114  ORF Transcript_10597/g.24114 Transcript_10597/m.24114 type:complete len:215 (+) Transcript_10597:129-773(+)
MIEGPLGKSTCSLSNKYKLIMLGDTQVGKTAILTRLLSGSFDDLYTSTIGIDFRCKNLILEDRIVRLQLWDTAGQERFRSLVPSYIRDSAAAVVVYDIANRDSFNSTSRWIQDVRNEGGTDVVVMLVGNKTDKLEERAVSAKEAEEKARFLGVMYTETSAKVNDQSIQKLFKNLAEALPRRALGEGECGPDAINLSNGAADLMSPKKKKKCLCC